MRTVVPRSDPVRSELERAVSMLHLARTARLPAATSNVRLRGALTQVSRRISETVEERGLNQPEAWSLLAVRDDLDSHLLAASAIAASQAAPDQVFVVLERGLDRAVAELLPPDPPPAPAPPAPAGPQER
jgi:hypothetical protein